MSKVVWLSLPQLELQDVNKTLKILGYKPYFIFEIFNKKSHVEAWRQTLLHKKDFDISLLDGYDAFFPTHDLLLSRYFKKIS